MAKEGDIHNDIPSGSLLDCSLRTPLLHNV